MRARIWWLSSVSGALMLLACNEILDNRKGILAHDPKATDTAPTHPDMGDGETATTPGGSRRGKSPSGPSDAATSDTSGDATSACPPGLEATSKSCGPRCVSLNDPDYGCAAADCMPCNVPGAIPTCVRGACAIFACMPGRADCNGNPDDGCEANLASIATCGTCSNVCPSYPHMITACAEGCLIECEPGWADCNSIAADGCETNIAADRANCGQCGHGCFVGGCAQGQCVLF